MAERLKQQISGQKSVYTKRINYINKLIKKIDSDPSEVFFEELKEFKTKLEETHATIGSLQNQIVGLISEPEAADTACKELNDTETNHIKNIDAICEVFKKKPPQRQTGQAVSQVEAAAVAAVNQANRTPKANTALAPEKLSRDSNPVELRSWLTRFRAFYSTSNLDKANASDQRAYFFAHIDSHLESRIRASVVDTTPVFGDRDSLEAFLQHEFQLKYPLFTRRLDFFRYTHSRGQLFSDFTSKLKQRADEARLIDLTSDEIIMFRYLCTCKDDKLVERLLKLEKPTLQIMDKDIRSYEAAKYTVRAMDERGGTSKVAKVFGFSARKRKFPRKRFQRFQRKGRFQSRNKKSFRKKFSRPGYRASKPSQRRKITCWHCSSSKHESKNCQVKENLHCKLCNKPNHVASVCIKSKRAANRAAKVSVVRVATVDQFESLPTPQFPAIIRFKNKEFDFDATPDSGATKTIASLNVLKQHGISQADFGPKGKMINASGNNMRCSGSIELQIKPKNGKRVATIQALVSPDLRDEILISWHDQITLGILPENFPAVVRKVVSVNKEPIKKPINKAIKLSAVSNSSSKFETPAMRQRIQHEIASLKAEFPDVLSDDLNGQCMNGPPMEIKLRSDIPIVPKRVLTARQVPRHYQEKANQLVNRLIKEEIITPCNEPTDWISPAHFVPKPGGNDVRLTCDLSELNRYVERPVYPFPTTRDILQLLEPNSKIFCKLDGLQGYFQIKLHKNSRKLTAFLLPQGKFCYQRAPMGLSSSSDEWCRRSDVAINGVPGCNKLVDDIFIQAKDLDTLLKRIRLVLEGSRREKLILSCKKFEIGTRVKFAGHIVSADGVFPDPEKVEAISRFPTPQDLTSLRGFLGLSNQLGSFVPDLAQVTKPLRELLKKDVTWRWLHEHKVAFEKTKEILTSDLVMKAFDPKLPTSLMSDASRLFGLGYVLLQHESDGRPRLICCGSRSLSDPETRYATIELECLGIQWAISKAHFYLYGLQEFTVVTDHKPLLGIFKKALADLSNVRLQRFREKLVDYNFRVIWNAGKTLLIADCLSRNPVFPPDDQVEEDAGVARIAQIFTSDPSLKFLFDAADKDQNYKRLIDAHSRSKDISVLPPTHPAKLYKSIWDELSLIKSNDQSALLVWGSRIIVPDAARRKILDLLHVPHAGIHKTRKAAQSLYYFPGINAAIKQITESCEFCLERSASQQKEPLIKTVAKAPMEQVSLDLFELAGKHYLIMVDRYSGFPFVYRLKSLTTKAVTNVLTSWFQDWGWPKRARSDGGPQFRSEFKQFCDDNNIIHELSSPYHSESNGHAEIFVKSMKSLLAKCEKKGENFRTALSEWRNVPRTSGKLSPAQLFLGRRQRGLLPTFDQAESSDTPITPFPNDGSRNMATRSQTDSSDSSDFNSRRYRELKPIAIGEKVVIQHPRLLLWTEFGVVESVTDNGRTYEIRMEDGSLKTRNRKFVKKDRRKKDKPNKIVFGDDKEFSLLPASHIVAIADLHARCRSLQREIQSINRKFRELGLTDFEGGMRSFRREAEAEAAAEQQAQASASPLRDDVHGLHDTPVQEDEPNESDDSVVCIGANINGQFIPPRRSPRLAAKESSKEKQ